MIRLMNIDRSIRISGNRSSIHFWKNQFPTVPTVTLDGQPVELVCEAKSGEFGFVVVEIKDQDGKLKLADVMLDGAVIDQVIARRTLRGFVEIVSIPDTCGKDSADG